MDVRNHKNWGHGLKPGTTEDINCHACKREKAEGKVPDITREGEVWKPAPNMADWQASPDVDPREVV